MCHIGLTVVLLSLFYIISFIFVLILAWDMGFQKAQMIFHSLGVCWPCFYSLGYYIVLFDLHTHICILIVACDLILNDVHVILQFKLSISIS